MCLKPRPSVGPGPVGIIAHLCGFGKLGLGQCGHDSADCGRGAIGKTNGPRRRGGAAWGRAEAGGRGRGLAGGLLEQGGDGGFFGGADGGDGVGDGPQGAGVELGGVVEAEGAVAGAELLRGLEEADDLAFGVGVGGHAVPGFGGQAGRVGVDEGMQALGQAAVGLLEGGDGGERGSLAVGLFGFGLKLAGALLHSGLFFGGEALAGGGGFGGLLGGGLGGAHGSLSWARLMFGGSSIASDEKPSR